MKKYKLGVIGIGKMGSVLTEGWLSGGVLKAEELVISKRNKVNSRRLNKKWKLRVEENSQVARGAEVVLLAVEPDQFKEVLELLNGELTGKQLLVSVVAGVRINKIRTFVNNRRQPVVRVMPNTPLQVGKGVAAIISSGNVSRSQKAKLEKWFGALGMVINVGSEDELDRLTTLFGCGPAYFYYFVEALAEAAEKLGIKRNMAVKLAEATFIGSALLMQESKTSAEKLIEQVVSEGGMTDQALKVFKRGNLNKTVTEALGAAYKRAIEVR